VVVEMVGTEKANNNHETPWTDDRVNWLKELWNTGMRASQIGRLIGVSRNAIIGKANRLGLVGKPKPAGQTTNDKVHKARALRHWTPPPVAVAEPVEITDAPFLDVSLYEIKHNECHFPHGDQSPYFFCGQPVQAGSPYCPFHHRLACHPAPSRPDTRYHYWGAR
jgi:GcrA cell cycle regulator